MNTNRESRKWVGLVLVAVAAGLAAAPAVAQSKASTKSVDSLNAVIKEVEKGRDQVQGSMESLDKFSSGGDANLPKNYKAFSKQVADVAKTYETATKRAEEMKSRRESYLQEWQKKTQDVSNPEIQAHMQARAEQVGKIFDGLQPAGQAIKEAFPPFLSDLQDIEKLLSVDLSASGVAAAAPIGQKAVANGNIILQNIDTYLTALTQIRDQVSAKKK